MRPPERIYLQIDPDNPKADFTDADYERISDSDVEYVIEKRLARWKNAEEETK